uniref:Nuclear nucleic acid-binding protein C1D n=1 Tax=Rhodnius prolixus TaxID=13249 RepID=T1I8V0_RHOPR
MNQSVSGGELTHKSDFFKNLTSFKDAKRDIETVIDLLVEGNIYDKLTVEEKVKHDLFVSYSLSSLFWMCLRTQGINPTSHVVKAEIERIQQYVKKYNRVKERKKAPQLQKAAANRFVKHGLWDPKEKPETSN